MPRLHDARSIRPPTTCAAAFHELRDFYAAAANSGDAMAVWAGRPRPRVPNRGRCGDARPLVA